MRNILYQIQQKYSTLTKNQKKIADLFLQKPKEVIYYSTDNISEICDVSNPTISRFSNVFNYSGLKEMQVCLARELSDNELYKFISPESEEFTNNLLENILSQNILALNDTSKMMNEDLLKVVSQKIIKADKILLSGVGASNLVALDFMQKLLRLQKNAVVYNDIDLEKIVLVQYVETDIFIGISYSGEKKEVLNLARQAKKQGVPVVAITRIGDTTLSRIADYTFEVAALEDNFRSGALSSRIVQLFVVDLLFHSCCQLLGETKMKALHKTYDIIRES